MASTRVCVLAAAVALTGLATAWPEARAAQPQSGVAASYGAGVHNFYAGSYHRADAVLTQVIESVDRDPRAYYFRAMARLRLGRSMEAEMDMKVGAALEAMNPGQQLSVSQALQRVQGYDRQTLEKHRRAARVALAAERSRRSRARYEGLEDRESVILRSPQSVPLDNLLGTESEAAERVLGSTPALAPPPAEALPAAQPDPPGQAAEEAVGLFGEPAPVRPELAQPEPAEAEPAQDGEGFDDLFGEPEPADPQPVMEEDPFGGEPAEADPFGADPEPAPTQPADADPFGSADEPEPAEPEETDLFGEPLRETEEPSAFDDDLFGTPDASAADPAASQSPDPAGPLDEQSKVAPQKLLGVLGRVIGRASPLSGLSVPQLPGVQPLPGAAQPMAPSEESPFDFGPPSDESTAEADPMDDDPFGAFEEPAMVEDDPFGAPADGEAAAESMPADDDPFGSAEDDPFGSDDPFGDAATEDTGEPEPSTEETEEPEDPFDGF
ncbi:MAG: hypothetical protein AAGA92_04455 [Planctomycetota bacterium]